MALPDTAKPTQPPTRADQRPYTSRKGRNFEGRLLVERAIEIDRNLPVVVLTECLDMGYYLEAMQLGAADYVEKPPARGPSASQAMQFLQRSGKAAVFQVADRRRPKMRLT